jgi:hypothetical protein
VSTPSRFQFCYLFAIEMAASGGQLGVTGPLSLALPSDADRRATEALVDELKRQNNYESATETNKRYGSRHPIFSPHFILVAIDGAQPADPQSPSG